MGQTRWAGRAVVLGSGMAGLFATRVLADHFDEVVLVDRDDIPDAPRTRPGIPQGKHFHALLPGGLAIARQLGGLKGNRNAVAETIENNVRKKIIREHLNDPAFYEKMSKLLDEIIASRRAKAIEYEEYLKRIADLAAKVQAGQAETTPAELNTPGRRALYNNLKQNEPLAIRIDETIKQVRPDAWRGVAARENVIKSALYGVLHDHGEVERIFLIIQQQSEY